MSHMSAPHIRGPLGVWVPYCQPRSPGGHKSQGETAVGELVFLASDRQTNSHYILAVKPGNEEKQFSLQ